MTERTGWRKNRNNFFSDGNDFCWICGKTDGRLHVHHLEGFRNVAPDDLRTVCTVCPKHHSLLEKFTTSVANFTPRERHFAANELLGLLRQVKENQRLRREEAR